MGLGLGELLLDLVQAVATRGQFRLPVGEHLGGQGRLGLRFIPGAGEHLVGFALGFFQGLGRGLQLGLGLA